MNQSTNLLYVLPEIILILTVLFCLTIHLSFKKLSPRFYHFLLSLFLPVIIFILIYYRSFTLQTLFSGHMIFDNYGNLFKLILSMLLFGILISTHRSHDKQLTFEQYLFINIQVLGTFLLVSTTSLFILFLTLEFIALTFSFFMSTSSHSLRHEKMTKTGIFQLIITAIFLYGLSLLYGTTGAIYFSDMIIIKQAGQGEQLLFALGMIILIFTIIAKTRIFHFTNDNFIVFKQLNTKTTIMLSILPKFAGLALIGRICMIIFYPLDISWNPVSLSLIFSLIIIAIFTTYSNIWSLNQESLPAALWTSSNTHFGFGLIGIVSLSKSSASAGIFYTLFYTISIIGIYSSHILREELASSRQLTINFKKLSPAKIPRIIFIFNIIGLPFTAGYISRLELIKGLLAQGPVFILLSVVLIFNWLLLIFKIHFASALMNQTEYFKVKPAGKRILSSAVTLLLMTSILFFGIYARPLMDMIKNSLIF